MSTTKRKIGVYSVKTLLKKENNKSEPLSSFVNVLKYINTLDKVNRILDMKKEHKIHLLKSVTFKNNSKIINLIFESAKYNHCPDLIDRLTAEERKNPKSLEEGEREKTHVAMYVDDENEEIIVLLEERRSGIPKKKIEEYLMSYASKYYSDQDKTVPFTMIWAIIPSGSFSETLKRFQRITEVKLCADKKILGSEFLNYSEKIEKVRMDIDIILKPNSRDTLAPQLVSDFLKKRKITNASLHNVRVLGLTDEGNELILDTDIMKRIEYVNVTLNKLTGEVSSAKIFEELNTILENMYNE